MYILYLLKNLSVPTKRLTRCRSFQNSVEGFLRTSCITLQITCLICFTLYFSSASHGLVIQYTYTLYIHGLPLLYIWAPERSMQDWQTYHLCTVFLTTSGVGQVGSLSFGRIQIHIVKWENGSRTDPGSEIKTTKKIRIFLTLTFFWG